MLDKEIKAHRHDDKAATSRWCIRQLPCDVDIRPSKYPPVPKLVSVPHSRRIRRARVDHLSNATLRHLQRGYVAPVPHRAPAHHIGQASHNGGGVYHLAEDITVRRRQLHEIGPGPSRAATSSHGRPLMQADFVRGLRSEGAGLERSQRCLHLLRAEDVAKHQIAMQVEHVQLLRISLHRWVGYVK